MKYVIIFFYIIGSIFSPASVQVDLTTGYEILNTFEENGILTVYKNTGDGVDILIIDNADFESVVNSIEDEWSNFISNKRMLSKTLYVFRLHRNEGDPSLMTNIVVIDKTDFVLLAYVYEQNKEVFSQFSGEFGEEVLIMLNSIRKGESYEKAWRIVVHNYICNVNFSWCSSHTTGLSAF